MTNHIIDEPAHENLICIALTSSEGSDEHAYSCKSFRFSRGRLRLRQKKWTNAQTLFAYTKY